MRSAHYRHTFGINLPKINVSVTPCFSYSHVNSESSFGFVDIGVIEAALEKLGIQVSASEVLEAIKDEVVKKEQLEAHKFRRPDISSRPFPSESSTTTPIDCTPLIEVDSHSKERKRPLFAMLPDIYKSMLPDDKKILSSPLESCQNQNIVHQAGQE